MILLSNSQEDGGITLRKYLQMKPELSLQMEIFGEEEFQLVQPQMTPYDMKNLAPLRE